MLLNERCRDQIRIEPVYNLQQLEETINGNACFECFVTVGDQVAKGCGQNKQAAKQIAAKAMLEKLDQQGLSVPESSNQGLIAVNNQQSPVAPPEHAELLPLDEDELKGL